MREEVLKLSLYKRKRSDVFMCKTLEKIQGKTAEELLSAYGISLDPPINLSELLKQIKISAIGIDFSILEEEAGYSQGDILGAAISNRDNLAIFYRKDDSENRQRFTIAHELGHCCLHSDRLESNHIELRENKVNMDSREIDANIFAGELLIPEESLQKICDKLLVPSLAALAQIFKVSTNVMAARMDYLSIPYLKDTEYTYS